MKENTQVIDKLECGLTHFFRVRVYNHAGISEPSEVSDPVLLPTNIKRGTLTRLQALVQWLFIVLFVLE